MTRNPPESAPLGEIRRERVRRLPIAGAGPQLVSVQLSFVYEAFLYCSQIYEELGASMG